MDLQGLALMLIVAFGTFTALSVFVSEAYNNYDIKDTNLVNASFNQSVFSEMQSKTDALTETVTQKKETGSILDLPIMVTSGVYDFLLLLTSMPTLIGSLIGQFALVIGVPGWVATVIITALSLFVVFGIVSIIQKYPV